jgi:hypothetical protein
MAAVAFRVFDADLGAAPRDWSIEFQRKAKELEAAKKAAEKKEEADRVPDTKPSLPLEKYAGTYHDDLYGDVAVTFDAGKLTIRKGNVYVGALEHWNYDTFRAVWSDHRFGKDLVTFVLNERGKADEVKIPGLDDLVARRIIPAAKPKAP